MIGCGALSGSADAVVTIGIVLTEAIVLYVGYGAITQLAGPTAFELLRGE